jgi:hypothetical protein
VFEDNTLTTVGILHGEAFMAKATADVSFINHKLSGVTSASQIKTCTDLWNMKLWEIKATEELTINLRGYCHIVLNAKSAPAADAVLCYDSKPCRNEVHQYKCVENGNKVNLKDERNKAAGNDDIIFLCCTSDIPSLRQNGYQVPPGYIVVTEKNWQSYFGPYAARSYIVARETQ